MMWLVLVIAFNMKRRIISLIVLLSFWLSFYSQTYSNCGGALWNWQWNWTVGANCTISNGLYSVWWDMNTSSRTVTISSNAALIMPLKTRKITFTSWKILMSWNAVIYWNNSEFKWYNPDTPTWTSIAWGSITSCPSWKRAWNPITRSFATTKVNASRRWYIICK